LYPLWESRGALFQIARGIIKVNLIEQQCHVSH
jgi:hypothetical protein